MARLREAELERRHRRPGWVAGVAVAGVLALALAALPSGPGASAASASASGVAFHDSSAPAGLVPPVAANGPIVERSVVGSDDRTQVTDTSDFPFSAIAYLELYDASNVEVGTCTGTFVGPDVLLTAGHCLWQAGGGGFTKHIRVVPGKSGDLEPFGSEYATDWWVPDAYINSGGNDLFDWGEIRLPDRVLTQLTGGWMHIGVLQTATLEERDFTPAIVGYPADEPAATMWGDSAPAFDSVEAHYLGYSIDTAGGESGSAVWSLNTASPYFGFVVGIHTSGGSAGGDNRGTRVDESLLGDLLSGCQQMGCALAYVVEPASGAMGFRAVAAEVASD
ncbi:MAG: trypsin-like serine peptidase [Tepidiformaceae bacterium]